MKTTCDSFYEVIFEHFGGTWHCAVGEGREEIKKIKNAGFPGGAVVKNPPASAGDMGLSPGPGRSHMPRSN